MKRGAEIFMDAKWISPPRIKAYTTILMVAFAIAVAGMILTARNNMDYMHRPLGTDFISFWTASKMALTGHVTDVYAPNLHYAAQQLIIGGAHYNYTAFFYPPAIC